MSSCQCDCFFRNKRRKRHLLQQEQKHILIPYIMYIYFCDSLMCWCYLRWTSSYHLHKKNIFGNHISIPFSRYCTCCKSSWMLFWKKIMIDALMYFEPIFDVTFMMASALSVVRQIRIIDIREQVPCITQIGKIQFQSKALNNVFKRTWCQT